MKRKPKNPTCEWGGHVPTEPAPAVIGVVIQRACAHGRFYVATCAEHEAMFSKNSGVAKNASTCEDCGHRGHARIVDTYQVSPGSL